MLYQGQSPSLLDQPVAITTEGDRLIDPKPLRLAAFYRVKRVGLASPDDSDRDGLDDIFESRRPDYLNPLDASDALRPQAGAYFIRDRDSFEQFSDRDDSPGALGVRQLKFLLVGVGTTSPLVYFMNSRNYPLHARFVFDVLRWNISIAEYSAQTYFTDTHRKNLAGSIVAYDGYQLGSATNGLYAIEFWPADPIKFDFVRKAFDAIKEQMPWAADQLAYHPTGLTQEGLYARESAKFRASNLPVILSEQLFGSLSFSPVYPGIAFGLLRAADDGSITTTRDIAIFQNAPIRPGRVAGIITATPQTPLSHFALIARQNRTPSAYIKNALKHPQLSLLVGKLIRLEVTPDGIQVREATAQEVQDWEDSVRPKAPQMPVRDLSEQRIRNLTDLGSTNSTTVGAKAANVAELAKILSKATVPEGYAIPYFFYDEFMKYNGFYEVMRGLMANPEFSSNAVFRAQALLGFRNQIINQSAIPEWMAVALDEAQRAFPPDARIRCRSSGNNEDLPGLNGAGLYDSFTHRPDEGALANTVKQVWASLWNLRAVEEREFQKIDHFKSAMGVLLHRSFPNEQANGVAVTRNLFDPNWPGFYVNAQIGENLVTNPLPGTVPDEFLVSAIGPSGEYEAQYVRYSNQTTASKRVLSRDQIDQLIQVMAAIQVHFRIVYQEEDNPEFAMELEFKITAEGVLSVKQARPWVN